MKSFAALSVLLLLAFPASAQTWLDRPLLNWNKAGAPIPAAPREARFQDANPNCSSPPRKPADADERAVVARGWKLSQPGERSGNWSTVNAYTSEDGMCRPLGFQVFLFMKSKFAGSIAPTLMDSRADGANFAIHFKDDSNVTADFVRYKPDDPLCCPSSRVRVSYRREWRGASPVLVPIAASPIPQ